MLETTVSTGPRQASCTHDTRLWRILGWAGGQAGERREKGRHDWMTA